LKSAHDLVGERYARALIELALTNELVANSVADDLKVINETINSNDDLKNSLNHPSYSANQKRALLKEIFMGQVQELTLRLLDLLVNRRRLDLLSAIEHSYRKLLNEKRNVVIAQLISSDPLSENNLADIKARLNEFLGKNLSLETIIDPSLIAGFVLRIGDQVIDGSLKGRLNNIEKVLLSV
jgi:F-type H+-transporting ATPase subunit delta